MFVRLHLHIVDYNSPHDIYSLTHSLSYTHTHAHRQCDKSNTQHTHTHTHHEHIVMPVYANTMMHAHGAFL